MARTPRQIYEEYNILPALQLHQLRVAAVAKMICDNFKKPINANDVILACLFHDMGNIIKADLSVFPEFVQPEGVEYWQGVKDRYVKKYGTDHHAANRDIAKELGLSERVVTIVENVGYSKLPRILAGDDSEQKIAEYADTRVGPRGVLSVNERMLEGKRRFDAKKMHGPTPYYRDEEFKKLVDTALELEQQIFAQTTVAPSDITDDAVALLIEELQNYPVA